MYSEDMRTEKINFTCESEDKEYLRQWAIKEGRTLSNLVERIVKEAIARDKANLETDLHREGKGAA
ncbi:ribbon-helix-helix domain-containing protein [Tolypothrix sp. VBCCA 56010]|uniref:ribbon-helix-helix domain-containing protein n=1 Tax=Tolypothrix sp. VBCCA 56010 TaxID=3137731 RepID=UPI003D7E423C